MTKIRKLISEFRPYLTNLEDYKIKPLENLKRGYGIIKNHKDNKLRPIVCSFNTMTSGAETYLRVSRSLNWHILDKILAKQSFKDIIQISQFVELAFILRKTCVKFFLHAYTPRHISETGRPKSKRKIYLLSGFILK